MVEPVVVSITLASESSIVAKNFPSVENCPYYPLGRITGFGGKWNFGFWNEDGSKFSGVVSIIIFFFAQLPTFDPLDWNIWDEFFLSANIYCNCFSINGNHFSFNGFRSFCRFPHADFFTRKIEETLVIKKW